MTTCDETGAERVPVDAGAGVDPGPGESTTDLLDADDAHDGAIYTLRRDVDAHGALVRGLAQYLWTLRIDALARVLRFNRVTEHAADTSDEPVDAPYAAVYGDADEGRYAGPPFTPQQVVSAGERVKFQTADGIAALFEVGSYTHDRITAQIWCDSEPERAAVIEAIEDMAHPHLARGGVYLRLRHYYGVVARFVLAGQARDASPTEIVGGNWIARFRFSALLPVIRVHRRPLADVRLVTTTGITR
jgi:hypothetical protein